MEVNQEGNKEEKHPDAQNPRDVGKEIDQGPSKDDIRMFTDFIQKDAVHTLLLKAAYALLSNVDQGYNRLSEDDIRMFIEYIHKEVVRIKKLSNVGKEIDQGPSTRDNNPKTLQQQRIIQKAIDQGLSIDDDDDISKLDTFPLTPKTLATFFNFQSPYECYLGAEYKIEKSQPEAIWVLFPYEPHPCKPTRQPSPLVSASLVTSDLIRLPDGRFIRSRRYVPEVLHSIIKSYNTSTRIVVQIAKKVKLEYLIHERQEIPEVRHQKQLWKQLRKQRRKLKREIAKLWKELLILKKESQQEQEQVDKRWSIQEEVANLFDLALKISYSEFIDEKSTILACIEKYGDFQCENVLSIWPKLRKEGKVHLGPRRVGWKIKKNLELLRSEMLEREPWVLDIGFVSIKLSGKWMAKSIHKMLTDGIDTWAPKLLMESVLVNFPSCNPAYLTQMDLLRRELIKTTLMRMLQYCKIRVEFSMPCGVALPKEQNDKFRFQERDEDVLIFRNNVEGEREPIIHAKRDGCFSDPLEDLADLWYGLEEKKADWIVCVTPVQHQEYIKMCIKAAQHAKWLPSDWRDSPRASYTGYQTYNTKLMHEDLDLLLDPAKYSCDAGAKELGYTSEQVLNCALKYTILKNDRLADYTCNSQEMLKAEENTFVHLLNTQARIHTFIEESRKDIVDLASELEFELGKGEIWREGVERVLVQHLLTFTQVIEESCLPVLPHILCEYLYDLSKNFNFVCEVGFVAKTTKLLLCEATGVVMEKCFQLLGITPESSSFGVDWPQASSSGLTKSLLQVERLNHKAPPKITTRFELFSVYPYITRDPDFREGNMFGQISICDTYSLLSDGWGLTSVPDHGYVALFDCDWPYSIDITNHRPVYFGNPSSRNLVPFSSFMEVRVELYASTGRNDAVYELCNRYIDADFEDFLRGEADTRRSMWISEGKDGHIRMYYILLKDAIDSTIKVTYHPQKDEEDHGGEVFAEIFAYYGSDFFDKKVDPFEKNYYTARLFRSSFNPEIPEIPLEKSMLAVPANGSLVIVARLWDVKSGVIILNGSWPFNAQPGYCKEQKMEASCGSLHVTVDWCRD